MSVFYFNQNMKLKDIVFYANLVVDDKEVPEEIRKDVKNKLKQFKKSVFELNNSLNQ